MVSVPTTFGAKVTAVAKPGATSPEIQDFELGQLIPYDGCIASSSVTGGARQELIVSLQTGVDLRTQQAIVRFIRSSGLFATVTVH